MHSIVEEREKGGVQFSTYSLCAFLRASCLYSITPCKQQKLVDASNGTCTICAARCYQHGSSATSESKRVSPTSCTAAVVSPTCTAVLGQRRRPSGINQTPWPFRWPEPRATVQYRILGPSSTHPIGALCPAPVPSGLHILPWGQDLLLWIFAGFELGLGLGRTACNCSSCSPSDP